MGIGELAGVMLTFLFAALVKGTTGLGFSTTCLPFLVLIVGIKDALAVLIVPALASNVLVMVDAGHFKATLTRFWLLYAAVVPGIAIGLSLLDKSDPMVASALLGLVLLAYCVFASLRPGMALAQRLGQVLALPVGLTTGILNGLTGCQVMPVLPYLLSLRLEVSRFVQAINCSGCISSISMAVGLAHLGIVTWDLALVSVLSMLPVYVGVELGNRIRRHLSA